MRIESMRMKGIRCFEDTGELLVSPTCNIIIGTNNTGKSTLLRGITGFQGFPFVESDRRPNSNTAFHEIVAEVGGVQSPYRNWAGTPEERAHFVRDIAGQGAATIPPGLQTIRMGIGNPIAFHNTRPLHQIVPFIARRKAMNFEEAVHEGSHHNVTGTFSNLFSRVDLLATSGHPAHDKFRSAVKEIVGLDITTKASPNGKKAGFYFNADVFIPMEQMGDGVPELVGLIVELCVEKNKVFVLEEPETNLHPAGLKALLQMVRDSWEDNQFFVATHSNIVLRELGFDSKAKIFRLSKASSARDSITNVLQVDRTTSHYVEVLRELGYEFSDLALYDGWLFLEESSAESVFNQVLIPEFASSLTGRLRTFSTAGVASIEPSIAEFQRLVTFVHLQPAYENRLWVRADGDAPGKDAIRKLRTRFPHFTDDTCATFTAEHFERYYPELFQEQAAFALSEPDKKMRREKKAALLKEVLEWTRANPQEAKLAWEKSAAEPIELLQVIAAEMI